MAHTNGTHTNGTHVNGTHVNPPQPPAPLPKSLKEVRAERRLLEANIELQRLQAAQRLMESSLSSLYGNQWGSFVDPRDALRGDEDYRPAYSPMSLPTDRSGGRNWPLFRTLEELSRLRQSSRVLCETNSQAKGMLRNQANYIIGTGFQYSAEPRDMTPDTDDETPGLQVAPDVQEAVDAAQAVIDDFLGEAFDSGDGVKLTPWARREREVVRRVPRDGEAFVRWFGLDDGTSAVRFIDPECVIQSPGASDLRGETLGIRHKMTPFEDVETAEAYYVCQASDPSNGEWVPAAGVDPEANSEVYHIRDVDHDSTVKRGIPAFVYDVYDAFARGATLQKNLSQGEALRAALSWIEQYETATKTQVTDFAAEKAVTTRTDPITGRTQQIEQWGPGTIARIPKGKTMLNPPSYQGTAATQQVVQGDFRQGIAAFCAPEYFTGDASNADYSSTKEAGAPWVKSASTIQAHYKSYFVAIMWRSLRWAERCGRLPAGTCEKIKIQVELPAILHKDPLVQAQTDQILIGIGVKDRDSVSAEWGYDPEIVKARNAEYAQANGGGGQMLQMPGAGDEGGSEGGGGGQSLSDVLDKITEDVKRDKLGHRYCISNGKRTKCEPESSTTRGVGAVDGDNPSTISPEEMHRFADKKAAKLSSLGSKVWGKVGAAGTYIKTKTKQIYDALEERYGRTQAIGIFAAGHVVGLATPIAVVPGSTIVGMVPFIAMAETYLQAKKGVKKLLGVKEAEGDDTGDTGDFEQLSQEQLMQLGRELVDQLKNAWDERIGECEDGSCEADAIGESLMEVIDDSGHEHAADGKFGKGGGSGGGISKDGGSTSKGGSTKKPTYHHDAIAKTKEARQARLDAWKQASSSATKARADMTGIASKINDAYENTSMPDESNDDHAAAWADMEDAAMAMHHDGDLSRIDDLEDAVIRMQEFDPKAAEAMTKHIDDFRASEKEYKQHRKAMNEIKQARC